MANRQEGARHQSARGGWLDKFFYTEECGLALFRHRESGKQFIIEVDCLNDLVDCFRIA